MMSPFLLPVSLACTVALCASASAQDYRYAVFDMGTFGGDDGVAEAINNRGEVVGLADETEFLFRAAHWLNGVLTDIDPNAPPGGSVGDDINMSGEIIGLRSDVGAVIWFADRRLHHGYESAAAFFQIAPWDPHPDACPASPCPPCGN